MTMLDMCYKYAKEYEKQGIVEIIKTDNDIKDDDIVKVSIIERIGGRRWGRTAKLKELINRSINGKESVK